MTARVFVNPRQPQTLYMGQILLYFTAVLSLLDDTYRIMEYLVLQYIVAFLMLFGAAVGAYGIANSKKWGYLLGVAAAVAPFVIRLEIIRLADLWTMFRFQPIGLMFDIAILALLLHPESRNYQKHWFE